MFTAGMAQGPVMHPDAPTPELETLLRHAAEARAGTARAVLVRGPAGIGRTRLLTLARQRLAAAGYTVRYAAGPPDGPARTRTVDTLLPAPSGQPAGPPDGAHDLHHRHALHGRALDLLSAGPLALVIDDAQWCDEASLRCADFILRHAAVRPLLLVLAQRTDAPGPGTPVLAEILAQGRCTVLEPAPLSEVGIAHVVTHTSGGPADHRFVRRCAELTGGNPLLLDRLLATLRTLGIPPDAHAVHQLSTVHQTVLTSRIPELLAAGPRRVRQAATALAVLGRATPDLLAALSGLDARAVECALTALRRIEAVAEGSPPLMREGLRHAVLATLTAPELRGLRVRAARVLSDAGQPAPEVAEQLAPLDRIDEPWMFAVLRDAAAEAPTRATVRAAGRWLRGEAGRALTDAERGGLHVELARAASRTVATPAHALRHLRQALALTPDPRGQAPVAVQYAMMALGTRRAPEGLRLLERVLDRLTGPPGSGTGPADRELRTTVESALLATAVNDRTALAAARARAAALPVPTGHGPADRRLLAALSAFAALDGGSAARAAAFARQALRADEPGTAGWGVFCSSAVLALADLVDEALAALDRVLSPAQAHPPLWPRCAALAGRSLILHGTGDVAAAARDAWAATEGTGPAGAPPLAHLALSSVLLSQGEVERAGAVLDGLARTASHLDRSVWEWHLYLYTSGEVRRRRGDLEGALDLWRRCGRSQEEAGIANPVLAPWWLSTATALGRLGRGAEAAGIVEAALDRTRNWGTPRALGLGLVAAASLVGGRVRTELLAEAVETLAGSPARLELARAEYRLGRELLELGDARAARGHLRQAIELATRCGSHALTATARDTLVTAGGRMPQLAVAPVDSLTPSERRIATLAQRGHSNKKIAEALFITPRTVEMHLTNVYRKLDVRGRGDLPRGLGSRPRPAVPRPAAGVPATP
ncbi:LuxR C-terminal-related transcriptional regulator [Streptomyces sp. NPDC052042]|uniref:helix-turn-helix transcriptional regulator n=1 Tax=Streptomyces sp. NPDC052042 TaxID=3365683 RepID=UPI0037D2B932